MTTIGTATNQSGAIVFPPGTYRASLRRVDTDVQSEFSPDGQILWRLAVEEVIHSNSDDAGDYIGRELHGFSSKSSTGYSPQHKTRIWYEALLGRPLTEGEAIDIDKVIGAQVVVTVVAHQRRDGTPTSKIAQEGGLQPYRAKSQESGPDPDPEVPC